MMRASRCHEAKISLLKLGETASPVPRAPLPTEPRNNLGKTLVQPLVVICIPTNLNHYMMYAEMLL